MDPNNTLPSETKGKFELDTQTGEWSFTPSADAKLADTILNYYIEADDGKGAAFHQRIEIRVEYAPTNITYHVDGDNGNDSNDGLSSDTAFKTIQKAEDIVRPGDTVIIHETAVPYCYKQKEELVLSCSGLPEAYITFKAADGEQPVINSAGCDYITLENNTITNCCWGDMWACSAVSVLGCIDIDGNTDEHKIIIRNNITAGTRHFVPWIRIHKFSDGNGIIIDSTKNENTHRALLEKGDKWGLQPYSGKFLIANNLSYFNGGSGIHAFDTENVDMINNTIFANSATPALGYSDFFSNASNNIVYSRTGAPENISNTSSRGVVYDNNLFYNYSSNNNLGQNTAIINGKPGTTAGENNIYGEDPLFVNAYEVNHDQGIPHPHHSRRKAGSFRQSWQRHRSRYSRHKRWTDRFRQYQPCNTGLCARRKDRC